MQASHKQHITPNAEKRTYQGSWLGQPIALCLVAICLPIMLLNSLLAWSRRQPIMHKADAAQPQQTEFSCGILRSCAGLLRVASGRIALCGIAPSTELSAKQRESLKQRYVVHTALLDACLLHHRTGLAVTHNHTLLEQQLSGNTFDYLKLCFKGGFSALFYRKKNAFNHADTLSLFGLSVDNVTMPQAVAWACEAPKDDACQVGVFVNANSINLSAQKPHLFTAIKQANRVFADGSGLRVASQAAGFHLQGNINGTDMLPLLCQSARQHNQSLFLLGAKPSVAEKTAENLQQQYPGLHICGVADGYFDEADSAAVIEQINQSGADILLVALGSPRQECWLAQHHTQLTCQRALAVGGLFDYFSGNIARAPLWMRELGLEWVWRLLQEPKAKFTRYVLGNPLFLLRIYLLKQHVRGL